MKKVYEGKITMIIVAQLSVQYLFYEKKRRILISIERLPSGIFWGTIFAEDKDES
jgi:hypothetical protein